MQQQFRIFVGYYHLKGKVPQVETHLLDHYEKCVGWLKGRENHYPLITYVCVDNFETHNKSICTRIIPQHVCILIFC